MEHILYQSFYSEYKVCFLYKNHKTSQNCEINCQNCLSYNLHIEEVKTVRDNMRSDTKLHISSLNNQNDKKLFSSFC